MPLATAESIAEAVFGQVRVGRATAESDFAKKLGVKSGVSSIVLLPYGDKSSLKKFSKFGVDDAGDRECNKDGSVGGR